MGRMWNSLQGAASVEFGILSVAAGTVGLVAATVVGTQPAPFPAPEGAIPVTVAAATPAPRPERVQVTDIQPTAYRGPVAAYEDSGRYRAFRLMIDPMEGDEVAQLWEGLPLSFEARLEAADWDGAAEVLDALQALDDSMRARGLDAPDAARPTTEAMIRTLAEAR